MKRCFWLIVVFALISVSAQLTQAQVSTRVLVLGDSLTEGYGVAKAKAYPALLEKSLHNKGYAIKVINAGSSGSTSASAVPRLKWHLQSKPDILLLALGGNDGLRGIKLESTKKHLATVIKLSQQQGIRVLLVGMQLPYNYGPSYRQSFQALFYELTEEFNIDFMPFLLKDVGGKIELNLPDLIHPNEAGHQVIAQNLLPYLENMLHDQGAKNQ